MIVEYIIHSDIPINYTKLAFNSLIIIRNDRVSQPIKQGVSALKEIGTIKRFYSVYGVYYVLLHFIQSSVIKKCGFIPEKRS